MFFVLSKLLAFLLQPLNAIAILFALGLLAVLFMRRRMGIAMSSLALLLLALSIWSNLGALMLQPLEARFQRPEPPPAHVTGIILLGGAFEGGINRARHGYELNDAGDRVIEAIKLARLYPDAKLLVSGGNGSLVRDEEPDADSAPALFSALGIPRDRLVLEDRSRNTYQNAVFSKVLVMPKPGDTWILVTSAFHMPRSVGIFRKVGFPVVAWPCDYRTRGDERFGFSHNDPQGSVALVWTALHEWFGLAAYWLTDRSSALFPAPVEPASIAAHMEKKTVPGVALASAKVGAR